MIWGLTRAFRLSHQRCVKESINVIFKKSLKWRRNPSVRKTLKRMKNQKKKKKGSHRLRKNTGNRPKDQGGFFYKFLSHIFREILIKMTKRCHYILSVRMPKSSTLATTDTGKKYEPWFTAETQKWYRHLGGHFDSLCKTVPVFNISSSNCAPSLEIQSQKNLHKIVSAGLFTMTQTCKQLSLDQWADKETVVQPDNTTLINVKWEWASMPWLGDEEF